VIRVGTPFTASSTKVMLLGAGELGKEVAIELQRFGCEVIACDRYAHAPAMQVSHRSHVFNMLDGDPLREVIEKENPHLIVPEIEAIATDVLVEVEQKGYRVVPTARAARLTMNREGIRRLVAETLHLPTSKYRFVDTHSQLIDALHEVGFPCVLKPLMSSSGKGQSVINTHADVDKAWQYAQRGSRSGAGRCIVEGFIHFDYEITMLTVKAVNGIFCCPPIGHIQIDGDYRESWQEVLMSKRALARAQEIATIVVKELATEGNDTGFGIFGVELFVRDDEVWFSEVSPRPHDTGMVTLVSQSLSEFALHARAILRLPIPTIEMLRPAASVAILAEGKGVPTYENLDEAMAVPESQLRLFGKPSVEGKRRVGVALATGNDVDVARARAKQIAAAVKICFA